MLSNDLARGTVRVNSYDVRAPHEWPFESHRSFNSVFSFCFSTSSRGAVPLEIYPSKHLAYLNAMDGGLLVNLHGDPPDCTAITLAAMPLEFGESADRGFVDRFGPNSHTVFDAVVVNDFDNATCLRHVDLEIVELG